MLKVFIIGMLIAFAAARDGVDLAVCAKIVRGICNGVGLLDQAACMAACGGGIHVGVCLAVPPVLNLGAFVCVCLS